METYLLHPSSWLFLGVGVIEKAAKLGDLIFVTRRMGRRHVRDGFVLGTAVGFGFAAFETAGYAFNALARRARPFVAGTGGDRAAPVTYCHHMVTICGRRPRATGPPTPTRGR